MVNMRIFVLTTVVIFISFSYSQISYAGCTKNGDTIICTNSVPNPDLVGIQEAGNNNNLTIEMQSGSIINTTAASTEAIDVGNGNNSLIMNNAQVISIDNDNAMSFGSGNNLFHISDSQIRCEEDCIDMGNGPGELTLTGSLIQSIDNNGIDAEDGPDKLTVIDSQILAGEACCNNFGVTLGNGDDELSVVNSRIAGFTMNQPIPFAITMGDGINTVRLGNLAQIEGLIRCNESTDTDTIVFEMAVPSDEVDAVNAEIATKNPAGDSIVINGLLYQWIDCDELVPQVVGGFSTSVPTLSQWGLIAMAGILGIVGLMVIRRRKATV